MVQPGTSDYRTHESSMSSLELSQGIKDQLSARGTRAETIAEELATAIKERPYTTLVIAAGLAFAVGALWKLGHQRSQTRLEALRARLPDMRSRISDLPSWDSLLQRRWR